jgi:hypothetical protein
MFTRCLDCLDLDFPFFLLHRKKKKKKNFLGHYKWCRVDNDFIRQNGPFHDPRPSGTILQSRHILFLLEVKACQALWLILLSGKPLLYPNSATCKPLRDNW